jgi:hypothetical protein
VVIGSLSFILSSKREEDKNPHHTPAILPSAINRGSSASSVVSYERQEEQETEPWPHSYKLHFSI